VGRLPDDPTGRPARRHKTEGDGGRATHLWSEYSHDDVAGTCQMVPVGNPNATFSQPTRGAKRHADWANAGHRLWRGSVAGQRSGRPVVRRTSGRRWAVDDVDGKCRQVAPNDPMVTRGQRIRREARPYLAERRGGDPWATNPATESTAESASVGALTAGQRGALDRIAEAGIVARRTPPGRKPARRGRFGRNRCLSVNAVNAGQRGQRRSTRSTPATAGRHVGAGIGNRVRPGGPGLRRDTSPPHRRSQARDAAPQTAPPTRSVRRRDQASRARAKGPRRGRPPRQG
jgi:hypothetical protein